MRLRIIASSLIFLFVVGCFKKEPSIEKSEIVFGVFGSYTGSESTFGNQTQKGINLAVDEINQRGGIKGKKVRLVIKDNESRSDNVAAQVNELIEKHQVTALIGEVNSQRSLVAGPIAQKAQVPMVSTSSTNPKVTQIGDYIFRVCYIDPFQGLVMAKYTVESLKLKSVAIFYESTAEYSKGLAENYRQQVERLGGTVLIYDSYKSGDIDFERALSRIKDKSPDGLFLPGYYTEVARIAKQARQLGITSQLLGGDGWNSPFLHEISRGATDGGFFSHHFAPESREPEVVTFNQKFREKYSDLPEGLAALGYDAVNVIAAALERTSNLSREELRSELSKTKGFRGVTGTITLNANRDAEKSATILRVDGPVFRYVATVHP